RAVLGVDYQQHGVDHAHHTFHFTAEVGVSGGVDDVDVVVAPLQRRVLGENGNAALFFLVVGVHDALVFRFFAVEGAGQTQQFVDEGGFAMVDVGDDGDVAQFFDHCVYLDQRIRVSPSLDDE